jgi:DNA (cytosine-5)-methyltransferase 1
MDMTHLSLFTGIGGLDLAAERAGFETVGQCEWADYPTKVIEKHWPDVPRWRDIHGLTADDFRRKTGLDRPTIISGGFPCQPHSVAGQRKASDDERDLWGEMRRVIGELQPRWIVAENVRGLLSSEDGRFFRGILRDFAEMGYDAGWCTFRAADVGSSVQPFHTLFNHS